MERGSMRCVLQMSRIAVSIGIVYRSLISPSTWLTAFLFHHFSVTWSTKETDTDLSNFQAFTSFTKSTNPQVHGFAYPRIHESTSPRIHESTNPRIHRSTNPRIHESTSPRIHESTNPRVNRPIWVCLSLHTVCCRPHFAHCTRNTKNWHCALLCQC